MLLAISLDPFTHEERQDWTEQIRGGRGGREKYLPLSSDSLLSILDRESEVTPPVPTTVDQHTNAGPAGRKIWETKHFSYTRKTNSAKVEVCLFFLFLKTTS